MYRTSLGVRCVSKPTHELYIFLRRNMSCEMADVFLHLFVSWQQGRSKIDTVLMLSTLII